MKQKPGLRSKAQQSAAEDKADYVCKALELSLAYTYMTKGQLIDFFTKATVTEKEVLSKLRVQMYTLKVTSSPSLLTRRQVFTPRKYSPVYWEKIL